MLSISNITCQIGNEEIVYIRWEDYDPFVKSNFEMYFFSIIGKLNRLGTKKLVLDCSGRKHDPSEKDFKEIFELFLSGLSSTHLEKMARICPPPTAKNAGFISCLEKMMTYLELGFQLRNFKNTELAFAWLREPDYHFLNNQRKSAS